MNVPAVLHPIVRAWRCRSRAHCCRAWRVDVTPEALGVMAARCTAAGALVPALRLVRAHAHEERLEGSCALPMEADGACLFLQKDRLCGYRLAHGVDTLPASCRRFPFLGMLTPKRRLYGLSFACPTALELLAAQTSDVWRTEPDDAAPAPTETLCDFAGSEDDGSRAAATAFWDEHWRWVELWHASEGTPEARLAALLEAVAGLELPRAWLAGATEPEPFGALVAAGADARVLGALAAEHRRAPPAELATLPASDDDALLARYLGHRLLVPEFLMTGASLG
ncbi:MAG: hypothetical protein IT373_25575, partial [Polyangiaceae bacterium]|nr:hypothetical protein [Polyangiaceae bacterium]